MHSKRFRTALSFPGERRDFVEKVVTALAKKIGRDYVFYDHWYEAELARPNLDTYLMSIYHDHSELLVVFLCEAYERKEWPGLEWRAIRDLIKQRKSDTIILFRFDDAAIPGIFSIDGYISVDKRSPEEVADLILTRLNQSAAKPSQAAMPSSDAFDGVVSDSGKWSLLDGHYFETESFRTDAQGNISVRLRSTSSEDDVAIRSLMPQRFQHSKLVEFAYKNDGLVVRPQAMECESLGDSTVFTVSLKPEQLEYGGGVFVDIATNGYSGEDIARLRATRILLNDPPPLPANYSARNQNDRDRALLESLITGIATPLRIRECPLRRIYAALKRDPKLFMEIARLSSIFALKAGFVVEHVLELKLGPLRDGRVHIRFRGRRRKVYSNVEATVFEIEGDCDLE